MTGSNPPLRNLDGYIKSVRPEFERMLGQIVEVPTVSSEAEKRSEIRKGAELAAQYLKAFGAQAEIVGTPGNPVIFGSFATAPANPAITIYNHLDVQPAQEPEWVRDPFVFHIQDGKYYGRGATDDKGPAITALFAARYAAQMGVPINIQFIWELEEEIGSPNFDHFLRQKARDIKTNSILVSDTSWISGEIPSVPYGIRGLLTVRLLLETAEHDAHSGLTGGAARNPIGELAEVISRCYDAVSGRVNIPDFYEDVMEVSDEEMRSFIASGFKAETFMRVHGLKSLRTLDTKEVIRRIWCLPTFEVHGIVGGYTGPGIKTVIPPRAEAKISMRLVPKQKPQKVFGLLQKFVNRINSDVVVESTASLEPYLGDFEGAYSAAARRAIKFGFGKEPAFIREGGSIGAVVSMEKRLRAPIIFMGFSLPEHGYHGPNEHYDWAQASGGIKAMVSYLVEAAKIKQ